MDSRETPRPRAVLFDLDGVLIDSYDAWLRLVQRARRNFGFEEVSLETFTKGWGQGVEDDAELLFPGRSFAEVDDYFNTHFMDEITSVVVFPESAATLDGLRRGGHPVAIVTNTRNVLAEKMLRALDLRGRVDALVASGDVPREKPAPDMLLEACRRLRVPRDRAVMVGDSRFDRDAAHAAHIDFIGFRAEGARSVESLDELPALLGKLP